eukprot:scaffold7774_cov258-Pinguiococcus_pyrenoidosus.AAC.2
MSSFGLRAFQRVEPLSPRDLRSAHRRRTHSSHAPRGASPSPSGLPLVAAVPPRVHLQRAWCHGRVDHAFASVSQFRPAIQALNALPRDLPHADAPLVSGQIPPAAARILGVVSVVSGATSIRLGTRTSLVLPRRPCAPRLLANRAALLRGQAPLRKGQLLVHAVHVLLNALDDVVCVGLEPQGVSSQPPGPLGPEGKADAEGLPIDGILQDVVAGEPLHLSPQLRAVVGHAHHPLGEDVEVYEATAEAAQEGNRVDDALGNAAQLLSEEATHDEDAHEDKGDGQERPVPRHLHWPILRFGLEDGRAPKHPDTEKQVEAQRDRQQIYGGPSNLLAVARRLAIEPREHELVDHVEDGTPEESNRVQDGHPDPVHEADEEEAQQLGVPLVEEEMAAHQRRIEVLLRIDACLGESPFPRPVFGVSATAMLRK